ncbi:unnamed protein product [Pelagomonas calceolata]|uniref:Tox-ART-HYD1 domain-containing protein n=2 Tax=Pelagomonas calceolata TaxID=35677 RepID=A0A8J2WW93_9STRA|nr:unnamed protein product [Pelagomonas calceolata]
MYAALLSGCVFAAALAPAVPLSSTRMSASRIMRQPGLSWTGLYDERGRPVTMDELRRHKFPPDADKYGNCPWRDATESPTHPIWTGRRFYGADGPEPLKNPWNHMMSLFSGYREGSLGSQREGLPYYLYHYTSSDAAAQIFESGKLLPSIKENGDAMAGDGVYFTSIPPWAEPDVLLANNFDGVSRRPKYSRAEAYIRIEAWMLSPDVQVMRANVQQNSKGPMKDKVRDVYLVPGKEALDLSKSQYTLLITEPEAWAKSNARKELIRMETDMERKSEEMLAINRESRKAMYDELREEDPWVDFSEEYASLAEEEREAQLRLQYPEEERCLDGCLRGWVYQQQGGHFRWEIKQAKKQRPRSRPRGRSKTK